MPDILIRGMEMPTGCAKCKLNNDTICVLIDGCIYDETNGLNRRPDCPLHELPEHGALIDRDRLMEDGWVLHKEVIRMGGYAIHEQPLNYPDIPVIVPASEEESNGDEH